MSLCQAVSESNRISDFKLPRLGFSTFPVIWFLFFNHLKVSYGKVWQLIGSIIVIVPIGCTVKISPRMAHT